jgi:uncharacterized membrane protein
VNGTRHREVDEYLRRLQRSMGDLPAERREEILAEIEEHIAGLLAETPQPTEADVRNVLERVGDPDDIAAEARERFEIHPTRPRTRASWTDTATVALLVLGSLMLVLVARPEGLVVAWVAAVVLLWISDVWSTGDKVRVTLVVLAGGLSAIATNGAGDPEGIVFFGIIVFASIWSPAALGLKLRRAHQASDLVDVAASEGWSRRTWLAAGVLTLVVLGATVVAFLSLNGEDTLLITQAQFDRVALGDGKDDVSRALGGEGDGGSIISGLDPIAVEEPQDVGDQQFNDCWSYPLTGSGVGTGSDAAVCFDSSDEVIYKRVRIAS